VFALVSILWNIPTALETRYRNSEGELLWLSLTTVTVVLITVTTEKKLW